ncbi:isocitrate dehydrogenase (NADP(+)) [bacterium]|nr:isocitrate dehydrogenase (NADP(+)) [bacterium]
MAYEKITPPANGEQITVNSDGSISVPNNPIIPRIVGDGIGPDISRAMDHVVNAAVKKVFGNSKSIVWFDVYAGDASVAKYGQDVWLPDDTIEAIKEFKVAIKGPLSTPVGGGIRSINVALRQILDLYACVRPVRWFTGVPAPVKEPQKLNVVIFRENTEDIYKGIEFKEGTKDAQDLIKHLKDRYGKDVNLDSGIGIKPISIQGTKRLVRMAIEYAIEKKRRMVTLVHKGNIMKFTEGAFRDWGYEVARDEFREHVVLETELWDNFGGKMPEGKILVNDRIADAMFQQLLLRPDEYDVIATPNLNGDYLSDACAAQVGGLGLVPGANIGRPYAVFEATHGTAPKYADKDVINPGSLILSAVMMLEHLGWDECAHLVIKGIEQTIGAKTVTYDLERQMEGATKVKCSEFAKLIAEKF